MGARDKRFERLMAECDVFARHIQNGHYREALSHVQTNLSEYDPKEWGGYITARLRPVSTPWSPSYAALITHLMAVGTMSGSGTRVTMGREAFEQDVLAGAVEWLPAVEEWILRSTSESEQMDAIDSLALGIVNAYGDLPLHVGRTMFTRFVERHLQRTKNDRCEWLDAYLVHRAATSRFGKGGLELLLDSGARADMVPAEKGEIWTAAGEAILCVDRLDNAFALMKRGHFPLSAVFESSAYRRACIDDPALEQAVRDTMRDARATAMEEKGAVTVRARRPGGML